jgi:hypothetical protein
VAEAGIAPMIVGHFGLAAAVKSKAEDVPLWSLMLGTQWLDIVFIPLFAAGIETIEPIDGGGYAHAIIHADYTHSLLGALILSALFGAAFALRWGRRAGWILAAMSFSHWLIDFLVHHPDLPILPGNWGGLPLLGIGLWRWPVLVMALETLLVVGGAWLYWRAARGAVTAAGRTDYGRADLVAGLIVVFGLLTLSLDVTGLVG